MLLTSRPDVVLLAEQLEERDLIRRTATDQRQAARRCEPPGK